MQEKAIQCFLNIELFNNFCFGVINNWKNSCEEHLNNSSLNKIAYMGQCALCYGFNIPEITTKKAWSFIDEKQKEILNNDLSKIGYSFNSGYYSKLKEIELWDNGKLKSKQLKLF